MSGIDVNAALIAYLGGGSQSAGCLPIGGEERLNAYCVSAGVDARSIVKGYVDRIMDFPLPADSRDMAKVGNKVKAWLEFEMPELSGIVRQKLANYYTYQWR